MSFRRTINNPNMNEDNDCSKNWKKYEKYLTRNLVHLHRHIRYINETFVPISLMNDHDEHGPSFMYSLLLKECLCSDTVEYRRHQRICSYLSNSSRQSDRLIKRYSDRRRKNYEQLKVFPKYSSVEWHTENNHLFIRC